MSRIIFANNAVKDLRKIREHLFQHNEESAKKVASAIIKSIDLLLTNPLSGAAVEDMPEYRDLIKSFDSEVYTIRYRLVFDKAVITGIKYGKENGLYF